MVERPHALRLPFDSAGNLLPNGPRFPARPAAPDIKGLPYTRYVGEYWTEQEHRTVILAFMRRMFRVHAGAFITWRVEERRHAGRSFADVAILKFVFVRRGRPVIEIAIEFSDAERTDIVRFKTVLGRVEPALDAQM